MKVPSNQAILEDHTGSPVVAYDRQPSTKIFAKTEGSHYLVKEVVGQGVKGLCHVYRHNGGLNLVYLAVLDGLPDVYKNFLSVPVFIEAFLCPAAYSINDFI